jgi:osmotically-inducible protein OsmY
MALQSKTLKPGLLVSLKTAVVGGVNYTKNVIEDAHITGDGAQIAKWETERTVTDAVEYEAAKKARGKARSIINGVCSASSFGLLCPLDKAKELENAVAEARKVTEGFNRAAKVSRVYVYVITGKIAADDAEAVKAINSEVRELLDSMKDGLQNFDVKVIREAASKAKGLSKMLERGSSDKIEAAIASARSAARKIVKAGENVSKELDLNAMRDLDNARFAFLDLDEVEDVKVEAAEVATVDLAPLEKTE